MSQYRQMHNRQLPPESFFSSTWFVQQLFDASAPQPIFEKYSRAKLHIYISFWSSLQRLFLNLWGSETYSSHELPFFKWHTHRIEIKSSWYYYVPTHCLSPVLQESSRLLTSVCLKANAKGREPESNLQPVWFHICFSIDNQFASTCSVRILGCHNIPSVFSEASHHHSRSLKKLHLY